MGTAQVSSSPLAVTPQMPDVIPAWKERQRKPKFLTWDWQEIDNAENECTGCNGTGINPFGDYPGGIDSEVKVTDNGIYFLDRQFRYVAKRHGCPWAVRGHEISAGFPAYLMRKAQDGFDWSSWKAKRHVYDDYIAELGERISAGNGLVFIGSVGTGKTHLAVQAGRTAVRLFYSVFFTTVTELLSDLRQTFRDGSPLAEKQIMEHVADVDLLILDDATVEKQTDWTQDALYRVVNARYETEKATMLTANTSLDGMRERLGERLVSRLYERSIVLDFTGPDYRLQIRKQRQAT